MRDSDEKNVIVNKDIHKKLKLRATEEGKSIKQLVHEILEKEFQN